ncbi:hypothetical protein ACLOJK_014479, partial [Asimina triloba]
MGINMKLWNDEATRRAPSADCSAEVRMNASYFHVHGPFHITTVARSAMLRAYMYIRASLWCPLQVMDHCRHFC